MQYTNQPFAFHSFSPVLLVQPVDSQYYRFEATFKPRLLAKAPAIVLTLPIPLSSLFDGIRSTTLRFNRTSICPHCSGTGASTPDHIHVCPFCNGTGIREYCTLVSHEIGYSYSTVCSVCGGSGHQPDRDHVCSRCGGSGVGKRRAFEIDSNRGRFCGHSSEWRNSERFYDFVQRRRSFFAFFFHL